MAAVRGLAQAARRRQHPLDQLRADARRVRGAVRGRGRGARRSTTAPSSSPATSTRGPTHRVAALQNVARKLGLTEIPFESGRSRFLGHELDHILVRGLAVRVGGRDRGQVVRSQPGHGRVARDALTLLGAPQQRYHSRPRATASQRKTPDDFLPPLARVRPRRLRLRVDFVWQVGAACAREDRRRARRARCACSSRRRAAPAPPKADPNAAVKRAASEVWIFAFPLVLTDVTREVQSAGRRPNTFKHVRTIPDATTADVASAERRLPLLASVARPVQGPRRPDRAGHQGSLLPARAARRATPTSRRSIGKRTTGTEKRQFAIVGPELQGNAPRGHVRGQVAHRISRGSSGAPPSTTRRTSPTPPRSRTSTSSPDQRRRRAPAKGAPPAKARRATAAPAAADGKSPRDQVAAMDAATFFARVAMLLPDNPPCEGRRGRSSRR